MNVQSFCQDQELKKLQNFPVHLPPAVQKYGNCRLRQGLKTFLFLAVCSSYCLLLLTTKNFSSGDEMALVMAVMDWNLASEVMAEYNGNMLIVKAVVFEERLLNSDLLHYLVGSLLAIQSKMVELQRYPIQDSDITKFFQGSGPIYRKNHTFYDSINEKTLTVPLFAHESNAKIHIYSAICTVPSDVHKSKAWKSLLALCNEASNGVFKVKDNFQAVFEISSVAFPTKLTETHLNALCDYASRVTHCYTAPIVSFIKAMAAGLCPNPKAVLLEANFSLKYINSAPEMPLCDRKGSMSLGANFVLSVLLNPSEADSEAIALVVDAILQDNSNSRELALFLEVSHWLNFTNSLENTQKLEIGPNPDAFSAYKKYVDLMFSSQEVLNLLQNRLSILPNRTEKYTNVIWTADAIPFWRLCCNLAEMYVGIMLFDRANVPKTVAILRNKRGELIGLQNPVQIDYDLLKNRKSALKEVIKLLQELNMRRISHLNLRLSTLKVDLRNRICLTEGYFSPFRIPPFSQAARDPLFCQEIDFIPPEIGQIMLAKDALLNGDSGKISDLQGLYRKPPDEKADSFSFGTLLYVHLLSPSLPHLSPLEAEGRLRRGILEAVRPIVPPEVEFQQPKLVDLMHRCWGERHTRPSISALLVELGNYVF